MHTLVSSGNIANSLLLTDFVKSFSVSTLFLLHDAVNNPHLTVNLSEKLKLTQTFCQSRTIFDFSMPAYVTIERQTGRYSSITLNLNQ